MLTSKNNDGIELTYNTFKRIKEIKEWKLKSQVRPLILRSYILVKNYNKINDGYKLITIQLIINSNYNNIIYCNKKTIEYLFT